MKQLPRKKQEDDGMCRNDHGKANRTTGKITGIREVPARSREMTRERQKRQQERRMNWRDDGNCRLNYGKNNGIPQKTAAIPHPPKEIRIC